MELEKRTGGVLQRQQLPKAKTFHCDEGRGGHAGRRLEDKGAFL